MSVGIQKATSNESVLRRESNSERAYGLLRERIRKRELLPGEVLSENSLARDFGMSRTPVHEAVLKLVQEGLLSVLPNRGILVASLSVNDLEEIYAIREVLEGLASRVSATRTSEADVARLRQILAAAEQASEEGDVDVLTQFDHEFHAELARQSRNERLEALLANMRDADVLQQYGRHDAHHLGRYRISVQEHRKVLDAVARRDPDAAEAAMRDHCRSAARFIADYAFGGGGR